MKNNIWEYESANRARVMKITLLALVLVALLWCIRSGLEDREKERAHYVREMKEISAMKQELSELSEQIDNLRIKTEAHILEPIPQKPADAVGETSRGDKTTKAVVTAYTHTGNRTASGTWPKVGRTCAGPRWIPFGTRVYIQGVGWRVVEDRTHIRFNGRFDIFMGTEQECLKWGIQKISVTIKK